MGEAAVALIRQAPNGRLRDELLGPVYDEMRREISGPKAADVTFIDGTAMFDHVPGPVFADYCCHILRSGNRIMLERILEVLGSHLTQAQ